MMIILKHCIKIDLYMIDIHVNAILLGKKNTEYVMLR